MFGQRRSRASQFLSPSQVAALAERKHVARQQNELKQKVHKAATHAIVRFSCRIKRAESAKRHLEDATSLKLSDLSNEGLLNVVLWYNMVGHVILMDLSRGGRTSKLAERFTPIHDNEMIQDMVFNCIDKLSMFVFDDTIIMLTIRRFFYIGISLINANANKQTIDKRVLEGIMKIQIEIASMNHPNGPRIPVSCVLGYPTMPAALHLTSNASRVDGLVICESPGMEELLHSLTQNIESQIVSTWWSIEISDEQVDHTDVMVVWLIMTKFVLSKLHNDRLLTDLFSVMHSLVVSCILLERKHNDNQRLIKIIQKFKDSFLKNGAEGVFWWNSLSSTSSLNSRDKLLQWIGGGTFPFKELVDVQLDQCRAREARLTALEVKVNIASEPCANLMEDAKTLLLSTEFGSSMKWCYLPYGFITMIPPMAEILYANYRTTRDQCIRLINVVCVLDSISRDHCSVANIQPSLLNTVLSVAMVECNFLYPERQDSPTKNVTAIVDIPTQFDRTIVPYIPYPEDRKRLGGPFKHSYPLEILAYYGARDQTPLLLIWAFSGLKLEAEAYYKCIQDPTRLANRGELCLELAYLLTQLVIDGAPGPGVENIVADGSDDDSEDQADAMHLEPYHWQSLIVARIRVLNSIMVQRPEPADRSPFPSFDVKTVQYLTDLALGCELLMVFASSGEMPFNDIKTPSANSVGMRFSSLIQHCGFTIPADELNRVEIKRLHSIKLLITELRALLATLEDRESIPISNGNIDVVKSFDVGYNPYDDDQLVEHIKPIEPVPMVQLVDTFWIWDSLFLNLGKMESFIQHFKSQTRPHSIQTLQADLSRVKTSLLSYVVDFCIKPKLVSNSRHGVTAQFLSNVLDRFPCLFPLVKIRKRIWKIILELEYFRCRDVSTFTSFSDAYQTCEMKVMRGRELVDVAEAVMCCGSVRQLRMSGGSVRQLARGSWKMFISNEWTDEYEDGIDGGGLYREVMFNISNQMIDEKNGLYQTIHFNDKAIDTCESEVSRQRLMPSPTLPTDRLKLLLYMVSGLVIGRTIVEGNMLDYLPVPFHPILFADPQFNSIQGTYDLFKSMEPETYRNLTNMTMVSGDDLVQWISDEILQLSASIEVLTVVQSDSTESPLHLHLAKATKSVETQIMPTYTWKNLHMSMTIKDAPKDSPVATTLLRACAVFYCIQYMHNSVKYRIQIPRSAFQKGLEMCIPKDSTNLISRRYLVQDYFGLKNASMDASDLLSSIVYEGLPFNPDAIDNFKHIVYDMTNEELQKLLQFWTGQPTPPVGGYRAFSPNLCVFRVDGDTDLLPESSTCGNMLRLPDDVNYGEMKRKLKLAINESVGFFRA
eukprot:GHVH01006536.1.p1 GENE.GHVH01006536.1~~GHVH01006536.1.p1  ORF type:complete len:1336 (+),score=183.91 GHVH01006536.1:44-4051(+)